MSADDRPRGVQLLGDHDPSTVAPRCSMAPPGWACSRNAGHEGPCAARKVPGSETTKEPWGMPGPCSRCRAMVIHLWQVDGNCSLCGECADRMEECPHETTIEAGDTCAYCGADLVLMRVRAALRAARS